MCYQTIFCWSSHFRNLHKRLYSLVYIRKYYLLIASLKVLQLESSGGHFSWNRIWKCIWFFPSQLEIVVEWVMKRQPFWIKILHISRIFWMIAMVGLVTKKSEGCYLCCVACGGYMQGKTCNVFFHCRHCSVQCFDSPSN